jgi:hypothetical protein
MDHRRALLVMVMLVGVVAIVPAAVAGQTATDTLTPGAGANPEQIDENTRLVSATYDKETGQAVVIIESDSLQDVVISDAGAFMEGGIVEQRTVTLKPGERATVRMPVTKVKGYVGVSIATRSGALYAVPMEIPARGTNPFTQVGPIPAWIGGAGTGLGMTVFAAYRVSGKDPDEPEPME